MIIAYYTAGILKKWVATPRGVEIWRTSKKKSVIAVSVVYKNYWKYIKPVGSTTVSYYKIMQVAKIINVYFTSY